VDKLKTTPQEAIGRYEGAELWLERFLTFELRLVMSTAATRAKFRHSGEVALPGNSAGRAPSLRVIPWHSPYNPRKKHGENPQSG